MCMIYNYTRQYYLIINMSFLLLFFLNSINIVLICFSGRHDFMCYMAGCAFCVISLTYLYHPALNCSSDVICTLVLLFDVTKFNLSDLL